MTSSSQTAKTQLTKTMASKHKLSKRDALLVWGFIRTLEIMHNLTNIPMAIYEIVYSFQKVYEYFGDMHSRHILDDRKMRVTASTHLNGYGAVIIESTVKQRYLWKFKIISIEQEYGFGLGIIDNNYLKHDWPIFLCKGDSYGYCGKTVYSKNTGGVFDRNQSEYNNFNLEEKDILFKKDDIVEMELNMSAKVLLIKIEKDEIKMTDIDAKDDLQYRMGIYLHGTGNEIELLEYREFV